MAASRTSWLTSNGYGAFWKAKTAFQYGGMLAFLFTVFGPFERLTEMSTFAGLAWIGGSAAWVVAGAVLVRCRTCGARVYLCELVGLVGQTRIIDLMACPFCAAEAEASRYAAEVAARRALVRLAGVLALVVLLLVALDYWALYLRRPNQ